MRDQGLEKRWPWVFVDEYQDVDPHQYELLRLLVPPDGNICAIGDPDQAIYSFRGADVQFFLRFSHDFTDARVVRLTRNYRSSAPIIAAAVQAIAPGFAGSGTGASIRPKWTWRRRSSAGIRPRRVADEASFIAKKDRRAGRRDVASHQGRRARGDRHDAVLWRHRGSVSDRQPGGRDRRSPVARLDPGAETVARSASRPRRRSRRSSPSCAWTTG